MSETPNPGQAPAAGEAPERAGLILIALILVAVAFDQWQGRRARSS